MRTSTLVKTTTLLLAVALAAVTALPGAATIDAPTAAATAPDVAPTTPAADEQQGAVIVTDTGYEDSTTLGPVTVATVGETVTWFWGGFQPHSVTQGVAEPADSILGEPVAGAFDSGIIGPGGAFSHTFTESGVYAYYCSLHAAMRGTVVVA